MYGPTENTTSCATYNGSNPNTFTVPVSTTGAGTGGKFTFDQRDAVLRAVIRNLTISGYADAGSDPDYGNRGIVDTEPGVYHKVTGPVNSISGTSTVTVTSTAHTLVDGKTVKITGLSGYTLSTGEGPYTVDVTGPDTFTLTSASGSGTHTANTGVWTSGDSWPDREHGALVRSSGAQVQDVTFFYIPGTCLTVASGNSPLNRNGHTRLFDSEKARVSNCQFMRAYRGLEISMVDTTIGALNGFGLRDYGIKFTSGSTQIEGYVHFYGVNPGPALWFPYGAGPCQGNGPYYVESGPVGMLIESQAHDLTNIYSHTCWDKNIHLTTASGHNRLTNLYIRVYSNAKGLVNQGHFNTIGTAKFLVENSAGTGIQLLGNSGVELGTRLETVFIEGPPAGGQGVGIDVDAPLSDCRIIANFKNLEKGMDFAGGSIDSRNVIWIAADAGVTDVVRSLGSWNASNDIRIQGMKAKGGISNVTTGAQTRITSNAHGLANNAYIAIDGVRGVTGVNSTSYGHVRQITYIDANNFDLTGNPGSASPAYESGTGWWGEWQK